LPQVTRVAPPKADNPVLAEPDHLACNRGFPGCGRKCSDTASACARERRDGVPCRRTAISEGRYSRKDLSGTVFRDRCAV